MIRVEFRPRQWVSIHKIERKDSNIRIALNVHSQDLQAVIGVHLQLLITASKVTVAELDVVVFVCYLTEEIDAVELMEDFKADTIAFYAGLGVLCSEVGLGHADDF